MKAYHYLFCICLLFSVAYVLRADSSESSGGTLDGLWTAKIVGDPTGSICVPIRSINSVTIHHYLLNGQVPIAELTVDTSGNNSIRIYTVFSPTADIGGLVGIASGAAEEVKSVSGMPSVGKEYPNTTHAHSIEYCVSNENQLNSAYTSLKQCLSTGMGASISLK